MKDGQLNQEIYVPVCDFDGVEMAFGSVVFEDRIFPAKGFFDSIIHAEAMLRHAKKSPKLQQVCDFKIVKYSRHPNGLWNVSDVIPPARDAPILVVYEAYDYPRSCKWEEHGAFGDPAFVDPTGEFELDENRMLFWMYCPPSPLGLGDNDQA